MLKTYASLFITASLLPTFSNAQSNYKPGYVITLKGDTLNGLIDYKEWTNNPKKINFKIENNTNEVFQYSVKNINEFAIKNAEHYKRYVLSISQDYVNDLRLSSGIDTTKLKDTVFLRILGAGRYVTLYAYADDIKNRYFISEGKLQPTELIYHRFLDTDQAGVIKTASSYRNQLQRLALLYRPNDKELSKEIQNSSYAENNLFKIATRINGFKIDQKSLSDRKGLRFFLGLGLNISSINSVNESGLKSDGKPSTTNFPEINLGFDLFSNKNVGKLVFRTEVSLTSNKNNFIYTGLINNTFSYRKSIAFDQFIASLNPQLLYNINHTSKEKIYIAVGGSLNYSVYSNKKNDVTDLFGTPSTQSNSADFPYVHEVFLGLTTKIGLSINNRFQFYAGYNPPVSLTNNFDYTLKLSCYKAGINYLLRTK
jgi:hypothetical protein